ncbi:hypothetical protein BgAZ_207180 [Babesia gibsoni]|uniref:Ubiquinone biosynthesis O-methyltransferase, mitochondrial n=1 Tax=Babesia gibsoni TaxID=33632 RepID=A0AAD8PEG0_BABGI|nr:hypothetical protein BgAZ_207180 [Babesia gibsoni]
MSRKVTASLLPLVRIAKRGFHLHSTYSQEHFGSLSKVWWDIDGPLATLHDYNYVRVPFIAKAYSLLTGNSTSSSSDVQEGSASSPFSKLPVFRYADERAGVNVEGLLKGLRILDVGCGGGILSESLAKSGARVLGIDPSESLIKVAENHRKEDFTTYSKRFGLRDDYSNNVEYEATTVEEYIAKGNTSKFDIVVASEVLEHLPNTHKPNFISALCTLVKPGGILVFTTPGRTFKSCFTNIFLAESVLKLVPRNTHKYDMFISPDALADILKTLSFQEVHRQGVMYLPFARRFIHMPNCDFLYMIAFNKPQV